MMAKAASLKSELKRMFPNSQSQKPAEVKHHISNILSKKGMLRDYLKDNQKDTNLMLEKDKIVNEILNKVRFDKEEKVEFDKIKNKSNKDASKYKYFSKLMPKVDKINILEIQITPFQKFRSVAKGIYKLFVLYSSIK